MNRKEFFHLSTLTNWVSRYEAYCMSLTAHGCVAPPRHGTAMPRTRNRAGRGCKAAKAATAPLLSRLALHCDEQALHFVQLPNLGS